MPGSKRVAWAPREVAGDRNSQEVYEKPAGGVASPRSNDQLKPQGIVRLNALKDQAWQKGVWVEEARKLHTKLVFHEKEMEMVLSKGGSESAVLLRQLWEESREYATERSSVGKRLADRLIHIKSSVLKLKALAADVQPGPEYVATLTQLVDSTEAQMLDLKQRQQESYDGLSRAERALSRELDLFTARLDTWHDEDDTADVATQSESATSSQKMRQQQQQDDDEGLPPEVEEFEEFTERWGPLGGWEEPEHTRFLRILAEHHGDYSLVVEPALAEILLHDRASIIRHCRWHAESEDLLSKKRGAIQRWRARKDAQRAEARNRCAAAPSVKEAWEARRASEEEERREREEKARKLREWKLRKEEEDREKREQESAEERRMRRAQREANAERVEQRAAIAAVRERRKREAAEEAKRREREEERQRRRESVAAQAELQGRRREQDRRLVQQRSAALAARHLEKQRREERLEQLRKTVQVQADRDPHRLLRKTKAAEERTKPEDVPEGGKLFVSKVVNFRYHPTRATPAWREGARR